MALFITRRAARPTWAPLVSKTFGNNVVLKRIRTVNPGSDGPAVPPSFVPPPTLTENFFFCFICQINSQNSYLFKGVIWDYLPLFIFRSYRVGSGPRIQPASSRNRRPKGGRWRRPRRLLCRRGRDGFRRGFSAQGAVRRRAAVSPDAASSTLVSGGSISRASVCGATWRYLLSGPVFMTVFIIGATIDRDSEGEGEESRGCLGFLCPCFARFLSVSFVDADGWSRLRSASGGAGVLLGFRPFRQMPGSIHSLHLFSFSLVHSWRLFSLNRRPIPEKIIVDQHKSKDES